MRPRDSGGKRGNQCASCSLESGRDEEHGDRLVRRLEERMKRSLWRMDDLFAEVHRRFDALKAGLDRGLKGQGIAQKTA